MDIPWGDGNCQVSWGENCPCLRATQQSLTHPELWAQAVSLAGWVTRRQGLGLLHSCRLMPYGGECSTQERWGLWAGGERDSALRPCWLSLQLSPQSHKPQSVLPHSSLPRVTLLPPEPRVSGCGQDFVRWPFKRAPGCLLGRANPC